LKHRDTEGTERRRKRWRGDREWEMWRGKDIERGRVCIGLAGFGGRLSSGNSVDFVPLCFKKRGLKHRDTEGTERGIKRWRGEWIALKVARL
jgi:hypothetical protein